jgi:hypothetical protein
MFYFTFVENEKQNFTPHDKIKEYAKENNLYCTTTNLGTQILEVNCRYYTYDHYEIFPLGNNMENVTIFLKLLK